MIQFQVIPNMAQLEGAGPLLVAEYGKCTSCNDACWPDRKRCGYHLRAASSYMVDWQRELPEGLHKARKRRAIAYKGEACIDCGLKTDRIEVYDFDHRGDKKHDVSRLMRKAGWPRIQVELDKCDLVCSNCHRIRTVERTA